MVVQSQFIELVQRCNPEKKTLESICTRGPQNGFYRKGAEIDGTIPIVKMSQLFGFESMSDVSHFDLVSMTEDEIRRFSLTENDLLFGRRSLVPEGAGKCRRAGKIDKTVVFESSILRVSIDPAICYPRFIQAWTESPEGEQSISELRAGTSVVGITGSGLSKVMIPVPTKSVQDVFIGVAEQADKSKFDGLKSQFIARFGITEQSSYPVKTLREIALSSGEYGANTPATKYNPEKGRYIRITDIDEFGNLNDDLVSPEVADNKYLLHKGDLLFARTGATVGKTYLHKTGKALYAGYLIKYQFIDTVLPEFVFAYTHSKEYYQWVELTQKVGAQPNISAKQYDGLRIVVPPIEEQKSFVALMNQADKSKYLS